MDPRRNLRHELFTLAWPVGNVNHGFGQDMSEYQVEAIVESNFVLDLLGKLGRTLPALLSQKQYKPLSLSQSLHITERKEAKLPVSNEEADHHGI